MNFSSFLSFVTSSDYIRHERWLISDMARQCSRSWVMDVNVFISMRIVYILIKSVMFEDFVLNIVDSKKKTDAYKVVF